MTSNGPPSFDVIEQVASAASKASNANVLNTWVPVRVSGTDAVPPGLVMIGA